MSESPLKKLDWLILPAIGIAVCMFLWALISGREVRKDYVDDFGDKMTKVQRVGVSADLPSPAETWTKSRVYITEPFAKRGELDQGMLRFAWLSLTLVLQGYLIALVFGTPLGFLLGLSKTLSKMLDPIIEILRPVSPLAWLPLGYVLFGSVAIHNSAGRVVFGTSDAAALFTIAICSMWPTVLSTAVGVRAIPQDYLNVAKVLKLSKSKTLFKVLVPATLPSMFTGFRLSLGTAWLVIVAVEMLTGKPGIGGFLWQQFNSGSYAHIILCILTIGIVGFALNRVMGLVEGRFKTA